MTLQETLDKILPSFQRYYDIIREDVPAPFAAVAEFHSHDEQYFLIKSARLSESDSHEYIYFATVETLDETTLQELDAKAWEIGFSKVKPHPDHRNTDITLFIVADQITEGARSMVPKIKRYKSYKFGFQGWTHYRLVAYEHTSGRAAYNRQGESLKKLIAHIGDQHTSPQKFFSKTK